MKSNFEFLNKYWPVLAQLGANAENYLYSNPNACVYKLGMFAERLVQEILVFEHIDEPQTDNTHANRIRLLKRARLLPHEIDNALYVLRSNRNSPLPTGTDSVNEAKTLLSMTYNLAVWFMETYGDWKYTAEDFVMPVEVHQTDLKSVIEDQEKKIAELSKKLAQVTTAVSGTTQKERAKRAETVSSFMEWNEAQTRCLIDEQLRKAGWEADTANLRYSKGTRPVKGRNIAISEWPTNSAGTVLVAMYGQGLNRGRAAILGMNATTNQAVCALQSYDCLENKYLYYYFMENYWEYREKAVGGNQPNYSATMIGNWIINTLSFPEQTEIVRILDDLLAKEQKAKEAAETVLEQIVLIKKSILARAFRGELGTNDPAEESAVELLKKII